MVEPKKTEGISEDGGRISVAFVGSDDGVEGRADINGHTAKCGDDGFPSLGEIRAKAYLEGRLCITFIFPGTNLAAQCFTDFSGSTFGGRHSEAGVGWNPDAHVWSAPKHWEHFREISPVHKAGASGCNDKFVLVGYVEGMDGFKSFIPAHVRLEALDFGDDIFTGKLYLSGSHGGYKALLPSCEGELDGFRSSGQVSNHGEDRDIESASEVVDCIPDDKAEFAWDGCVLFDEVGFPSGLGLAEGSEVERFFLEKIGDAPVKVVDMMLGPIDL